VQTANPKAKNAPLDLLSTGTKVEGVNNTTRKQNAEDDWMNRFKQLPMIDYVNKQVGHKDKSNDEVIRKLTQLNNKMNLILEQVFEHRRNTE
jgi:hypothetical protein